MKNIHDRKFDRQLNHLQSVIGMPNWDHRNPSLSEMRENDRRVLARQAKGFKPKRKSLLKRLLNRVAAMIAKVFRWAVKLSETLREKKEPVKTGSECCG